MASLRLAPSAAPEPMSGIGRRLIDLLNEAETASTDDQLSPNLRSRIVDALEALRSRLTQNGERDPRSLFELDERLIELMDRLEDCAAEGGEAPVELQQEIGDYLE